MLKNHRNALIAPFVGIALCFKNKELRRLATWPWLIGTLSYIATVTTAYYAFPYIYEYLDIDSTGRFTSLANWGIWLLTSFTLLLLTLVVSLILVLLLSGFFQTSIAIKVLELKGVEVPPEASIASEATRTVFNEALKLLWVVPLALLIFIFGLIPFLTPIALTLGAWILSYQFVDIVLDSLKLSATKRFRFSIKHSLKLILFGFILAFCWAVPFLGIILMPCATAATAWLLAESNLLEGISHAQKDL